MANSIAVEDIGEACRTHPEAKQKSAISIRRAAEFTTTYAIVLGEPAQ